MVRVLRFFLRVKVPKGSNTRGSRGNYKATTTLNCQNQTMVAGICEVAMRCGEVMGDTTNMGLVTNWMCRMREREDGGRQKRRV